jgi:subtilase family serine protease
VRAALRLAVLAAGAGLAVGLALTGAGAHPAAPPVAADRVVGPMPGAAPVEFDLVLRLQKRKLDRYLAGLYDPGSPVYGHYVGPSSFGRRFGLSATALGALVRRVRAAGFHIVARYPERTSVRIRGSVASVRRAFGVTLEDAVTASGHGYHAPDRAPVIPRSLALWVDAVGGLDTRPAESLDNLPDAALRPFDATSAYDLSPLYQRSAGSNDGHGQSIAVLSIDRYSQAHLDAFSRTFKFTSAPNVQPVVVGPADFSDSKEADLDLEVIRSVAPKAKIIDYQLGFAELPDAINRVVQQGKLSIVSASFGACDATTLDQRFGAHALDPGFREDVENALLAAAAKGVSFFVSSGDAGAYECQRSHAADSNLTVSFPADAPYAVAVGGTVLSVGTDGSYQGETAWGDLFANEGGGGGLNPYDAAPPWQRGRTVAGVSTGKRQVPDVSAAAGSGSPWWVYDGSGAKGWDRIWGTSASAPFWAASMLVVQQYMEQHHAGPVCFAAPLLYAIGSLGWKYPPFHDIASGTNRYYAAGPGRDLATGLGSPDVYNLATAAVAYRAQHPLPSGNNVCRSQTG